MILVWMTTMTDYFTPSACVLPGYQIIGFSEFIARGKHTIIFMNQSCVNRGIEHIKHNYGSFYRAVYYSD